MTSSNNTIGIYTTDNTLVGTYDLAVTGQITLGYATAVADFNVTVLNECTLETISPYTVSNTTYFWNLNNL